MPTPKEGYRDSKGVKIPSVSTIVSIAKDANPLMWWSWDIANKPLLQCRHILNDLVTQLSANGQLPDLMAAISFLEIPTETFDYKKVRQTAADAGTVAHEMFYCKTHGQPFNFAKYESRLIDIATPAFHAFEAWAKNSTFEIIESEVSLVSEKHRFGGTRDAILIDGQRSLGDWKTSKALYPDMLIQLGGYSILDKENGGEIDGGYHILRFSKQEQPEDPVHFSHHHWEHIDPAEESLLVLRRQYELMQQLKRMAK